MAIAPAPSSTGKPSAPVSTSKWAYLNGPGVSRARAAGFSGCSPSARKPRLTRQRRHSPLGPHWVSGRPHVAHVPAVSVCALAVPTLTPMSSMREGHLRPSIFDTGGAVPHQYLPDPKLYCPLPLSTIHGNAAEGAKARCAELQLALPIELRLLPGWAPWRCRRRRTVLILRATQLCLLIQMRFANSATPVKRWSSPRQDRSNQRH